MCFRDNGPMLATRSFGVQKLRAEATDAPVAADATAVAAAVAAAVVVAAAAVAAMASVNIAAIAVAKRLPEIPKRRRHPLRRG